MSEQTGPGYDGGYRGQVPPMPPSAPHQGSPAGGYGPEGSASGVYGPGAYGPPDYRGGARRQPAAVDAYGQPLYFPVAAAPKGLSIASLCCGIAAFLGLGFFLLPQLAAVLLGHLALLREPGGRGLAIAGLVLGYIAIAITLLVVIVLGVAFSNADFVTR